MFLWTRADFALFRLRDFVTTVLIVKDREKVTVWSGIKRIGVALIYIQKIPLRILIWFRYLNQKITFA